MDDSVQLTAMLDKMFAAAIDFQKNGKLAEAEELYRKIISVQPQNPVAPYLLKQVEGAVTVQGSPSLADRMLLDAFKRYPSHYSAVLPYNLNWMLDDISPVHDFLDRNPIVVADIGARGNSIGELESLRQHLVYYGFDADRDECKRLKNDTTDSFSQYSIFPYYVGKMNGPVEFYLYRNAGESSRYKPGKRFHHEFNPDLVIERVVQVEGATLDSIIAHERLKFPDFLKLDTQGSELEILQASPSALTNALFVEVEVEFIEMYEGQPLFHDVARFMYDKGFELFYLNRVFQTRPSYGGEARGQIIFGDALFGRRENELHSFSPERLAKYVILLANYGYLDISAKIWRTNKDIQSLIPGMPVFFKQYQSEETRSDVMASDKGVCWQLNRRRNNQLHYDSDRSWPFR
ncbi:MAG: FkbM family methyltransferase [Geobacter sp.]|nr:MAG: FkbM family methyltransferase [Geobacter sp.]